MDVEDAEGFAAIAQAVALPHDQDDGIVPQLQEFDTIGQLYRSVQAGLEHLAERLGPERLFIGPPNAQATEEHFRWEELVAVTDLASARQAIDTIVEQGEGARGEWRDAHFGRLLGILDEYLALKAADPSFDPVRPVVAANVRPQATGVVVPIITDPGTTRAMDLLNVTYEVMLQLLSRYFAHTDETPEQLAVLADVSVALMYGAIKPLGNVVTTLPIGPDMPGVTAGPGFELFYPVDYLLPHREAAWVLMEERLRDAAAFAVRCGEACTPALMEPLAKVSRVAREVGGQAARRILTGCGTDGGRRGLVRRQASQPRTGGSRTSYAHAPPGSCVDRTEAPRVVICSNCGTENRPGAKFCSECATPLAASCPTCGTANPPGAKFCSECATPLARERPARGRGLGETRADAGDRARPAARTRAPSAGW